MQKIYGENEKSLSLDMTSTCPVHLKVGDLEHGQEDNVSECYLKHCLKLCEFYCDTGF